MAIGTNSSFKIYDPQFWSGVVETLQTQTAVFNEGSVGCVTMTARGIVGNFEKSSFLQDTPGMVQPRDPNSMADITDINLTMGENVGVKLNRRIGPLAMSRDSFKKAGLNAGVFSILVGQQVGAYIMKDYAESALSSVTAAIKGVNALIKDITGQAGTAANLNNSAISAAKFLMGDRASRIRAILTHSKPYSDLVGSAITDKVVNVADVVLYGGNVPTLGLPAIVADLDALVNKDASGNIVSYNVLLLTESAVTLTESEERDMASQEILGKANLAVRIQAEHAFNLDVKGCTWDVTNGGANPDNTALATPTNWDKTAADNKSMPGVALLVV